MKCVAFKKKYPMHTMPSPSESKTIACSHAHTHVVHFTCGNIFITQRFQHILLTILHFVLIYSFFFLLVYKMRAIAINQRNSWYWPCVFVCVVCLTYPLTVLFFCSAYIFFNVHSFIVCLFVCLFWSGI